MNNSSILNTTGELFLTESALSSNGNLSKSELTQKTRNNTSIQILSNEPPRTPKLSITLDQEEKETLRKHAGKFYRNSSIMDINQQVNGTLRTKEHSTNSTLRDAEVEDESVIPIDDEDDVIEVNILEKTEETQQSISNMFSHLQPDKTTVEKQNIEKSKHQKVQEPSKEQNSQMEQEEQDFQIEQKSQEKQKSHMEQEEEKSQMGLEEKESQMEHETQEDQVSIQEQEEQKSQMELEEQESQMEHETQEEQVSIQKQISHVEESMECSQFLPDETDLFQYPFIEVGRRLWPSSVQQQNYTKGCLWSPDGTCLLVPVHQDGMHIIELPTDIYTMQEVDRGRCLSDLSSAVHVKEGGTVYDCCWYPYMNSNDPATCCWLATRQHEPIHMWDAFSGELRCSYRGYDDVDEVESAISIIFSNDAQKVIGGYKKTIKIFDTNVPGRDCFTIPVKKAISCFALTTDNDNCVTAGTWTGYINHYDLRAPKLGPLFTLGGHTGGITWLKYSPTHDQSWYLFSGARKDNKILQWDMRNYTEPIQIFPRNVQTNQRIYYDLTPLHKWLATGDTKGVLKIWNLEDKEQQFELQLHDDCCNGVSFHPSLPIISTTSGQYHFIDVTVDEVKENGNQPTENIIDYENSLLFLWYGPSISV